MTTVYSGLLYILMDVTLFPFDKTPGFWIYRVHTQSGALLRRSFQAAGYDLTPEQWFILTRLREDQGMSQSRLGEKSFKDRHNITRILNLLEKRGYIERRANKKDTRAYRIFLTESGKTIQEELTGTVLNHLRHIYSGISNKDLSHMLKVLKQIVSNIESKDTTSHGDEQCTE